MTYTLEKFVYLQMDRRINWWLKSRITRDRIPRARKSRD
jgi:hypothetical protein